MKYAEITVSLLILILLLMTASCGEDNDDPTGPGSSIPAEAVATWTYQSATVNGNPIDLDSVFDWEPSTVSARFTIDETGSFVEEELDNNDNVVWTVSGTIEFDGNNFSITLTSDNDGPIDPPEVRNGTWALSGNQLTITIIEGENTIVLVATK